jgi:hypothetical protein
MPSARPAATACRRMVQPRFRAICGACPCMGRWQLRPPRARHHSRSQFLGSISGPLPWFDRAAGLPSPRPQIHRPPRADVVKVGRHADRGACADVSRPYLDHGEHGGKLESGGLHGHRLKTYRRLEEVRASDPLHGQVREADHGPWFVVTVVRAMGPKPEWAETLRVLRKAGHR